MSDSTRNCTINKVSKKLVRSFAMQGVNEQAWILAHSFQSEQKLVGKVRSVC